MSARDPAKVASTPTPADIESVGEGRYLYCIINKGIEMSLGGIGVGGNEVYTIPFKDISAAVHNCPVKPYESKDERTVKEWLMAHESIVALAMEKFGTVLPFGFDTIIKGDSEMVKGWLTEDYSELKEKLEKFKDKAEYGVQIFWDQDFIVQKIAETDEEVKKLKQEIETKPKGMAYMLQRKIEKLSKNELRAEADKSSKAFYEQINPYVEKIEIEDVKKKRVPEKWKDKEMILSLSCLVHKDKVEELGEALKKIDDQREFFVRFTGPWAPYTFIGRVGKVARFPKKKEGS